MIIIAPNSHARKGGGRGDEVEVWNILREEKGNADYVGMVQP